MVPGAALHRPDSRGFARETGSYNRPSTSGT